MEILKLNNELKNKIAELNEWRNKFSNLQNENQELKNIIENNDLAEEINVI